MTTINISLPAQLKNDAEALVKEGFYMSFSDVVRDSLRKLVSNARYDHILKQTKNDYKAGKTLVMSNKKDIDNYFKSL